MQKTVVILLSDKRSGSTMFEDELCRHPDIQHVEYTPHSYFETHHWLKAAVVLGMAPETFSGGCVYPGYGSAVGARSYLIDCIKKNVPQFSVPENDRTLIFHGWDALCERFANPVFFEKSPQILAHWASLSLLYEWMQSTDYKVKIIGLTRNPLSVQYSAYKLFHTDPKKRQFGWLETQKNLLAFQALLPVDSFMHVRYEDIITQHKATFARVCGFIGVSEDHGIGSNVHSQSINKWMDDPRFTIRLDETVKQIAYHFGYTDEDLTNPLKTELPRWQKIRERISGGLSSIPVRLRDRWIKPLLLRIKR
ncbi:hypothetical protein MNBD_GAMMA26-1256 [hydrothermal vent metagenome]|uniref:Sulfotransferase domain-containing protein n=1 Tax=hydrothermal vent metagenome TaxID=652676 RepID=A0A3B1B0F6_9ZZZZ